MSAVDDVYNHILSSGIAGGATSWKLLRRRLMDGPAAGDQIVVVAEDGGTLNEMGAAEGIGDAALNDTGVMVTVRAKAWDGDAAAAKAQEIHDLLHGIRGAVIGADGQSYLRVVAVTPAPIFAGYDDTGRPLHTIAFRLLAAVLVIGAVVTLAGGGWAIETARPVSADAYIVSDGSGGFVIDTEATSGLDIEVHGGRPYIRS